MQHIPTEIITIGDELLYGHITDTNAQWISDEMGKAGFRTVRKTTVGDDWEEIKTAFKEAEQRAKIILITGGLGPTADDLTKPILAEYFNSNLVVNEDALKNIREIFEKRGFELSERNKKQAELPDRCSYIPNSKGTAPGMWFEKDDKVFVSMPGVPHEMQHMMLNSIIPKLKRAYRPPVIYHKMINTSGVPESRLADKIKDWEEKLPMHMKLAYLPSLGMVKLRLTAFGEEIDVLKKEVDNRVNEVLPVIEKYVYGFDDDTLAKAVGNLLLKQEKTIGIAESCSTGFVSYTLTSIPGSSMYFNGGIVAYQNEIKIKLLGVNPDTISQHGAVSEQTVKEMADGVRKTLKTDIGVSSSGIAGPGGGTEEKPVGLVWIAVSDGKQTRTKRLMLTKDRDLNIKLTAVALLTFLRQTLTEND